MLDFLPASFFPYYVFSFRKDGSLIQSTIVSWLGVALFLYLPSFCYFGGRPKWKLLSIILGNTKVGLYKAEDKNMLATVVLSRCLAVIDSTLYFFQNVGLWLMLLCNGICFPF